MRKVFDNLTGGLSLREPQLLGDNQFTELKNFFYNADKRLQTRYGYQRYFPIVPDTVVQVDSMDAISDYTGTDDATNVVVGAPIRGSNSLSFDINVSLSATDQATVTKPSLAVNISATKDYLGKWVHVPAGFNTNLTAFKYRLGSDAANYYEWTLPALTEATDQYVKLNFSAATVVGTPVDTTITYERFQVTYAAGYLDQLGIRIDAILTYSSTYTKPVTSYFFNRNEANDTNITICVAGDNMFLYNEGAACWERIVSSLTEFETAPGRTTQRTRWEFFAYNGSGTMEVGCCNGIDDYRVWNGITMTSYPAQPKCRYFLVFEDTIYSGGADANPMTIYYTAASPANAHTLNTSDVDVGNEVDGRINGLFPLAQSVMAGKNERVYYFDVVNSVCLPLDSQNGMYGHRAIREVGNGILLQTKSGVDSLAQKRAVTGAAAVESESYSSDLESYFNMIAYNNLNASCGLYIKENNNYHVSIDTDGDNKPDKTLVYSSLIGKSWSEYVYPSAYTYGTYIDPANAYHYLMCSATAGLIWELESGFDDDGSPINFSFKTKEHNFQAPYDWKDFEAVTISGLKNLGSEMLIDVLVDGAILYSATLDDTFLTSTSSAITIGSHPIGREVVGGGVDSSDIEMYPYTMRLGAELFASGQTIQIQGTSDSKPLVLTLDRIEVKYQNVTDDMFPAVNFA
jgi:hypothetical protein